MCIVSSIARHLSSAREILRAKRRAQDDMYAVPSIARHLPTSGDLAE